MKTPRKWVDWWSFSSEPMEIEDLVIAVRAEALKEAAKLAEKEISRPLVGKFFAELAHRIRALIPGGT